MNVTLTISDENRHLIRYRVDVRHKTNSVLFETNAQSRITLVKAGKCDDQINISEPNVACGTPPVVRRVGLTSRQSPQTFQGRSTSIMDGRWPIDCGGYAPIIPPQNMDK